MPKPYDASLKDLAGAHPGDYLMLRLNATQVRQRLEAITDLKRLERIFHRLLEARDWDNLLDTPLRQTCRLRAMLSLVLDRLPL